MVAVTMPLQTTENDDKPAIAMMEQCKPTDPVDTLHNDEGLRVLAEYDGDTTWDPSEEKRLVRKIDWRLLPIMCGTYALSYYDKVMISQAVCNSPDLSASSAANQDLLNRPYSVFEQTSVSRLATGIRLRLPSIILVLLPAPIQRSFWLKGTQSSVLQHL
jgi:hypothetical protein